MRETGHEYPSSTSLTFALGTDRRIRNAYAMTSYADAKAELGKIFRQLERINPSAAHSLEEGLEETLTVHRLGVGTLLRQTLASSNPRKWCHLKNSAKSQTWSLMPAAIAGVTRSVE